MSDKYKIKKIKTNKHDIPQRQCSKDGILPRFAFSMLICAPSGGGKTNLLLNILTNPHLYGNFFHEILVFSPTAGELDDMYKVLKLKKENFIRNFDGETLQKIINIRKAQIKKDGIEKVGKTNRVLIIMDDIIADKEFLSSPQALQVFCLLRHYLVSVIILIQSYNKVPPSIRKNVNATCVFVSKQAEIEVLIDEITPSGMKKREFEKVIDYCCTPTKDNEYPFLYINNHAKRNEQIRKNLDEVITPDKLREILSLDTKNKISDKYIPK